LWDSKTSTYAGLLTTSDYLNVVQYYWQNPDALAQIDQFKLNSLRDIERALGVTPIETVSIHPLKTLYEACRCMLESRARRIPLVDIDDETQREMVVSVLTQYRILKFVSVNVKETQMLRKPLRDLHVGSYENLSYAHMDSPVIEVIQALVKRSISCVPILDRDGMVLNVFEAVDVIALIKGGDYDNLQLTVGKALEKRSDVSISLQHYHPHVTSTLANSYFRRTSRASTPAPSTTASTPSSTLSANPACTASSSSTSAATL
jgi:5'-AMP-activated protein kinase regulatory gamma subunit